MRRSRHYLFAAVLASSFAWQLCAPVPAHALPASLSNLEAWYDATDAATLFQDDSLAPATPAANGDPVGTWLDKSGNGHHALVNGGVASRRPVRNDTALNGNPGVRFDSIDDGLDISNSLNVVRPYTFFIVDQYNGQISPPNVSTVEGRTVDSRSINWLIGKHGGRNRHFANGWVAVSGTDGVAGVPVIGTALGDTSAPNSFYFINGTDFTTDNTPTGAPGLLRIGRNTLTERSDFDISELIVFDRVVNSAERIIVENYLNSKYDIDQDGTTPIAKDVYAGDLSGNGDYDRDVFGFGQNVDGSFLTSSNSAGLQLAEANGSLDNDEWVLAGHKTPTNGITDNRWDRVWFVDETGVTDAEFTFDFSDAGLSPPFDPESNSIQHTLLFSPTDPFSFTALPIAATVNGDQVSFVVPDGQLQDGFYTLSSILVPEPSSFALVGLSLVGFARYRRRKR